MQDVFAKASNLSSSQGEEQAGADQSAGKKVNEKTEGWSSERARTKYEKQSLTIALKDERACVNQLVLTAHAYKIARKVHVSAVCAAKDGSRRERRKLGWVSFTDNRESGFNAREMKTIHLYAEDCCELMLEFDEPYANERNKEKQVGIAKVQIIGTALDGGNMQVNTPNSKVAFARTPEVRIVNSNVRSTATAMTNTPYASPPLFENMPCDKKTAQKIQETQILKQKAVDMEDYDEAKRLRDVMSRLRRFGASVAALEAKKLNAVRLEDYETAKILKAEIEKMDFESFEKNVYNKPSNNSNANSPILGMRVKSDENGNEIVIDAQTNKSFRVDSEDGMMENNNKTNFGTAQPLAENNSQQLNHRPDDASAIGLSNDEIPARATGRLMSPRTSSPSVAEANNNNNDEDDSSTSPVRKLGSFAENAETENEGEESWRLSTSEERDAEPMIAIFGAEIVTKLIKSERWRTRDAALTEINQILLTRKTSENNIEPNLLFVALCRALSQKSLCDKIASVFIHACETLRNLCAFCCEQESFDSRSSGGNNVSAALSVEVVPLLLERLAEAHARARDAAKETLAYVASTVERKHESYVILEKIIEAQKKSSVGGGEKMKGSSSRSASSSGSKTIAPRAMVKRLETLGSICSSFDRLSSSAASETHEHRSTAASKALMFCCKNLENNSGDVRKAAVECCADISKFTGKTKIYEKLPKTLKASIRDAVERAVDSIAEKKADDKENGGGGIYNNNNNNNNNSVAAAAIAYDDVSNNADNDKSSLAVDSKRQSTTTTTTKVAAKVFEAPTTTTTKAKNLNNNNNNNKLPSPKDEDDKDDDDDDGDFPTIEELEEELAKLALTKGARHPDYARVLVDIAAAKSDKEDYTGAVTIYEQALRIQENALGDDHPSSVQTLTDLAICRLDLGETHKGKPLLERALVLQKQQLGDTHADVLAIEEVLLSLS